MLGLSGNLRGQDAGGMERAGVRVDSGGRQCQRMFRFSVTQAWSRNWASRSGTAEGAKKLQGLLEDARGLPLGH